MNIKVSLIVSNGIDCPCSLRSAECSLITVAMPQEFFFFFSKYSLHLLTFPEPMMHTVVSIMCVALTPPFPLKWLKLSYANKSSSSPIFSVITPL